jgi:hypothetical protein
MPLYPSSGCFCLLYLAPPFLTPLLFPPKMKSVPSKVSRTCDALERKRRRSSSPSSLTPRDTLSPLPLGAHGQLTCPNPRPLLQAAPSHTPLEYSNSKLGPSCQLVRSPPCPDFRELLHGALPTSTGVGAPTGTLLKPVDSPPGPQLTSSPPRRNPRPLPQIPLSSIRPTKPVTWSPGVPLQSTQPLNLRERLRLNRSRRAPGALGTPES